MTLYKYDVSGTIACVVAAEHAVEAHRSIQRALGTSGAEIGSPLDFCIYLLYQELVQLNL
jgi:hypothetical protein